MVARQGSERLPLRVRAPPAPRAVPPRPLPLPRVVPRAERARRGVRLLPPRADGALLAVYRAPGHARGGRPPPARGGGPPPRPPPQTPPGPARGGFRPAPETPPRPPGAPRPPPPG